MSGGSIVLLTLLMSIATRADAQPLRPLETGDASLSGTVIDRRSKQPIEGAIVELALWQLNGRLLAQTDARGRFVFEHIAPGRYRVIAKHPDYAMQAYGTIEPSLMPLRNDEGIVSLDRGQRRSSIDFALARGASVSGRVTTADGKPLEGATVRATLRRDDGGFTFVEGSTTRTNARGEYVVTNLPEGYYDVAAIWGEPASRGAEGPRPAIFVPGITPPVFHPGTSRAQDREAIKVEPGAAIRNIDIRFPPNELVRISGQVVRSSTDGEVEAVLLSGASEYRLTVGADGRFSTPRMRSGRYTLFARSRADDHSEAAWLSVDLMFEMTDVVLALLPTGSIAGKVTTDDGKPIPDMLQIAAVLTDEGTELDPNRRDRAFLEPDGAFEIRGLFGPRVLRAVGVTEGWAIDRVIADKAPVTSFTMEPGSKIENVTVVLKQRQ
jgi:hypothetical protein